MPLSLVKLSDVGSARYVAEDPKMLRAIRQIEKEAEQDFSPDEAILEEVVKAAVTDQTAKQKVTKALVASGRAPSIVEAVVGFDRMLDQYQPYITVLNEYQFNSGESELGKTLSFHQPESIFEMVLRAQGVAGAKEKIVLDGALRIAQQYYGKGTWKGESPKERMVIPFLERSNGKMFQDQVGYVGNRSLNGKKLVVADFGEALAALVLELMNQGFPHVQVGWKFSRVFMNNGGKNEIGRLGSLCRDVKGVDADDRGTNGNDRVYMGVSPES